MRSLCLSLFMLALAGCASGQATAERSGAPPLTTSVILERSALSEWRGLDLDNTLVMELAAGPNAPPRMVVIELAAAMAPKAAANIKILARTRYFDGLSVNRVQDNFVAQWGDPAGEGQPRKPLGDAAETLDPEFERLMLGGPGFTALRDRDGFAPEVGFIGGFPAARAPREGTVWLAHCYAMVGVGRDNAPNSGNGSELYAVIGHSPRQLDRNITLAGRVVWGIEHLSSLPRGSGPLGFYQGEEPKTPIRSVRVASDLPGGGLAGALEALRTDSTSFTALTEARRNRKDTWYLRPAGSIDLCNVLLPVRRKAN